MLTNRNKIPRVMLLAEIAPPSEPPLRGLYVNKNGHGSPMTGPCGICYNFRVGDRCADVLGFHIIPGVVLKGARDTDGALYNYAYVGTPVKLLNGEHTGYVIGKCSGAGNGVIGAAFPEEAIQSFKGEERFSLVCQSCGLELTNYPDILCMVDPDLLDRLPLKECNGQLQVPIAHILPARVAGGLGSDMLSIMNSDEEDYEDLKLSELRFGDFVMLTDIDATYDGATYLEGAVTIGVVIDSGAPHVGGGPTVDPIFSCKTDILGGYVSEHGNLSCYFTEVK